MVEAPHPTSGPPFFARPKPLGNHQKGWMTAALCAAAGVRGAQARNPNAGVIRSATAAQRGPDVVLGSLRLAGKKDAWCALQSKGVAMRQLEQQQRSGTPVAAAG